MTARGGVPTMVLGDRDFDPDGVTGIQRNKGKHLGIALNINRGPSRRHSRLSRLSGEGGDPLAVILDFPVAQTKSGRRESRESRK